MFMEPTGRTLYVHASVSLDKLVWSITCLSTVIIQNHVAQMTTMTRWCVKHDYLKGQGHGRLNIVKL